MNIFNFPIVKIAGWYILGIFLGYNFSIPIQFFIFLTIISLLGLVIIHFYSHKKELKENYFSVLIYFLFCLLGILNLHFHNPTSQRKHFIHIENIYENKSSIEACILEKLKPSEKYDRFYIQIKKVNSVIARGKVLLQIKKDSLKFQPTIGQEILLFDKIVENFKLNNPNQFDYGNYLKTKGVYGQIFTKNSNIRPTKSYIKNINYYTAKYRDKVQTILKKSNLSKENIAMFMALMLGQQQDISNETIQDYQYAGAVHILSVSGLHVGFILIFINFLLKRLPKNTKNNSIKIIISIVCLWLFALVAGLSPSVVRSAAMFSFIAVGQHLKSKPNTIHTTIISLFVILLFEPNFLFDIGFQLSYLAVFFILGLQPILNSWYHPQNKTINYFWDILTVSLAAQIGTLPLSLYYFHQFPGLFFITNLAIIPLVSIIMAIGCIILLFATIGFIPFYLTKLLDITLDAMNGIIHKIATVENFIWKEIPMSLPIMIWLYVILVSFIIWYYYPSFKKLFIIGSTILSLQLVYFYTKYTSQTNIEMIIFNCKNQSIVGVKKGQEIIIYTNDTIEKNGFNEKTLLTFATANYAKITNTKSLDNTLSFSDKRILIIDKKSIYNTSSSPDIIILSKSPKINLSRVIQLHKPKLIIADGSNYKTNVDLWKATCLKQNIPFHSTYEKGYYKLISKS